jgi:hypothetical protein
LILERYYCLYDAEIYTSSFCESDVLTNPDEPTFDSFEVCYDMINFYDYSIESLCDYVYPAENQYFGEFNEECKSQG